MQTDITIARTAENDVVRTGQPPDRMATHTLVMPAIPFFPAVLEKAGG